MKVEQLNSQQIDWTKPQVVVSENGNRFFLVVNKQAQDESRFCAVCMQTGNFYDGYKKDSFKPENATSYPIELKLTIESDRELCNLLHRVSLDGHKVDENIALSLKHESNVSDMPLYNLLEQLAKERNLYKND